MHTLRRLFIAVPLLFLAAAFVSLIFSGHGHTAPFRLASHYRSSNLLESDALSPAPTALHIAAPPTTYTVRPGDTLWHIAQQRYGDSNAWPVIWQANKHQLGNETTIVVGELLTLPLWAGGSIPEGPAPAPVPTFTPAVSASPVTSSAPVSTGGMSSFEACVIRAESGGNPDIWNASGHWGLFQFSASTWAAAGGDPGLFGNASASYQMQVFDWAYAKWGTSPWAPYDGC